MKTLSVVQKYLLGMALWMGLYMIALFSSIYAIRTHQPQGPILYVLAVLPALPIGGTIWTIQRYIGKADEYVRAILSRNFVVTTGIVLFFTAVWGFLESNAGIEHFPLMWIFPLFWAVFGVIQLINKYLFGEVC